MKEVKRCSLAGIAFTLDHDAFNALASYLEQLKERYAQTEGGEEIVADIETRIAELILDHQANSRVVELPLVEEILRQMGSAEEIEGEDPAAPRKMPHIVRRIYRDVDNAKMGGVLSGLAAFFDIDRTWLRLGYFLPLMLIIIFGMLDLEWLCSAMGQIFGIINICYLIMWFAIPGARSARQRLEMTGERITEQTLRDANFSQRTASTDPDGRPRTVAAGVLVAIGQILLFFLKLTLILLLVPLIFAFGVAVVVSIGALNKGAVDMFNISPGWVPGWTVAIWGLTLAVVLVLIIYVLFCLIAVRKTNTKILCVMAILLLLCGAASTAAGFYAWRDYHSPSQTLPAPTRNPDNLMNEAVSVDPQTGFIEVTAADTLGTVPQPVQEPQQVKEPQLVQKPQPVQEVQKSQPVQKP